MKWECKVPSCKEEVGHKYPICDSCIRLTIRRFMHVEGSKSMHSDDPPTQFQLQRASYWFNYLFENLDELIAEEQKIVDKYGNDYDRDSETPWIREIKEDEEK